MRAFCILLFILAAGLQVLALVDVVNLTLAGAPNYRLNAVIGTAFILGAPLLFIGLALYPFKPAGR